MGSRRSPRNALGPDEPKTMLFQAATSFAVAEADDAARRQAKARTAVYVAVGVGVACAAALVGVVLWLHFHHRRRPPALQQFGGHTATHAVAGSRRPWSTTSVGEALADQCRAVDGALVLADDPTRPCVQCTPETTLTACPFGTTCTARGVCRGAATLPATDPTAAAAAAAAHVPLTLTPAVACATHADCDGAHHAGPYCVDGACVACATDAHCPGNERCLSAFGACVEPCDGPGKAAAVDASGLPRPCAAHRFWPLAAPHRAERLVAYTSVCDPVDHTGCRDTAAAAEGRPLCHASGLACAGCRHADDCRRVGGPWAVCAVREDGTTTQCADFKDLLAADHAYAAAHLEAHVLPDSSRRSRKDGAPAALPAAAFRVAAAGVRLRVGPATLVLGPEQALGDLVREDATKRALERPEPYASGAATEGLVHAASGNHGRFPVVRVAAASSRRVRLPQLQSTTGGRPGAPAQVLPSRVTLLTVADPSLPEGGRAVWAAVMADGGRLYALTPLVVDVGDDVFVYAAFEPVATSFALLASPHQYFVWRPARREPVAVLQKNKIPVALEFVGGGTHLTERGPSGRGPLYLAAEPTDPERVRNRRGLKISWSPNQWVLGK